MLLYNFAANFIEMAFLSILLSFLLAGPFDGAMQPVTSKKNMELVAADTMRLSFDLDISNGWHVYSTNQTGGPTSAEIQLDSISGARLAGDLKFEGDEQKHQDAMFGAEVSYFEKHVRFIQDVVLESPQWYIEGNLTYGACNDENCLPPTHLEFTHSSNASSPAETAESNAAPGVTDLSSLDGYDAEQWAPVSYSETPLQQDRGLLALFLTSMLGGLLALLTPCVWPIIPMTVSFFMKRSSDRRKAMRDAIIYGLCIMAVYVSIGLAVTLIFGANALNSLATNAIVNIIFFVVLAAFAFSFFGLFEITLPSGWSTGTDRKARNSGFAGLFFMALTLAIVSFSCTGPIIGFLLVDAAQNGSILAPTIGMTGFSLALAIPFALFAMFPGWLESLPRSGGWMQKVKVTLGFVELAFSLKFLSVADMAYGWGILPRELFIILWIIMAVILGLYLLGIIKFGKKKSSKKSKSDKPGPVSIVVGIISLLFAAWLVPGLWGAQLKAISAFCPPMSTRIFKSEAAVVEADYTDYAEALDASRKSGKPVLVDFTGFGCVNCRKMEAAVWTDPDVSAKISNDYILVSLYVDDRTALEHPATVTENGQTVKIRTVGDKWSLLQRYKFAANAQPFYVIVNADGDLLAGPYTFDQDVSHFMDFLKQ